MTGFCSFPGVIAAAVNGVQQRPGLYALAYTGMVLGLFAVIYLFCCLIAAASPAVGLSEAPEVDLKKPWDRILFFLLAKGKMRGYMLHAVFCQIGIFTFLIAALIELPLELLHQIPNDDPLKIPSIIGLCIAGLGLIISLLIMVFGKKRR